MSWMLKVAVDKLSVPAIIMPSKINLLGAVMDAQILSEVYIRATSMKNFNPITNGCTPTDTGVGRAVNTQEARFLIFLGLYGHLIQHNNLAEIHSVFFSKITSITTFTNTVSKLFDSGFIDKYAPRGRAGFTLRLTDLGKQKFIEIKNNVAKSMENVLSVIWSGQRPDLEEEALMVELQEVLEKVIEKFDRRANDVITSSLEGDIL